MYSYGACGNCLKKTMNFLMASFNVHHHHTGFWIREIPPTSAKLVQNVLSDKGLHHPVGVLYSQKLLFSAQPAFLPKQFRKKLAMVHARNVRVVVQEIPSSPAHQSEIPNVENALGGSTRPTGRWIPARNVPAVVGEDDLPS